MSSERKSFVFPRAVLVIPLAVLVVSGCVRRYEAVQPERGKFREPAVKTNIVPKAPPIEDERPEYGYVGAIRRVTSRSYRPAFDGSGKLEMFMYSVIVFDSKGRFLSEVYFDPQGKETSRLMPLRDGAGRLVSKEYRSPSGALELKTTLEYDVAGRLIGEVYLEENGTPRGGYRYEYDSAGRLVKRTMRNECSDGIVMESETFYLYDNSGRLVEEIYTSGEAEAVDLRIEHAYLEGLRVRSSDFQRGNWLEFLTFYEYDGTGNCIRESSYQIPDNEYGDSFASAKSPEGLPKSFLASVMEREYE